MTQENNTNQYFTDWHFYKADKQLFNASHWIDDKTGEQIKLTHNIKAVYFHKLHTYKSFVSSGKVYKESHQTVADKIGVSLKTVEEVAIPLLKRMGLIHIEKIAHKNYITTVFSLSNARGKLININLSKHLPRLHDKPAHKEKITYTQLQNIEKNKKKLQRIKNDMTQEFFILTKSDMERLKSKA